MALNFSATTRKKWFPSTMVWFTTPSYELPEEFLKFNAAHEPRSCEMPILTGVFSFS
jgi:hypothetical protein